MIRIVLVDDHALVRTGLRMILEKQPDMEIAGEAEDGVFVGELVVDADRIEGVGLRDLFLAGRKGVGRRNKPSVQQGRRARQRAATGRSAEENEAKRKPPLAKAMHDGAPVAGPIPYFFL